MSRYSAISSRDESKLFFELNVKENNKPLCPNCYNGEILFLEMHKTFMCDTCKSEVLLMSDKKKRLIVRTSGGY